MVEVNLDSYTIEHQEVIEPIYELTQARRIFPVKVELNVWDTQYIYWTGDIDFRPDVRIEPTFEASHVDLTKNTVPVGSISAGFSYTPNQLARIQNSLLPQDGRVSLFRKEFSQIEDIIALGGDLTYDDGTSKASIVTTGTNSTAVSSNADVTTMSGVQSMLGTMVGDLENGGIEIGQYPLILVLTKDVSRKIHAVVNANTDLAGYTWLKENLRIYHPQSEIVITKYLGATHTRNQVGQYSVTNGSTNAALIAWSPDIAYIVASPITPRVSTDAIRGYQIQYEERWRTIFIEKAGIIYDSSVTIA